MLLDQTFVFGDIGLRGKT